MDVSAPCTPTSLIMDFTKGPICPSPSGATAFEFDFINGTFFNEDDDILSSLYNKAQPQSTNGDVLLPDSPDSWVSNSSLSDNDEDLELCGFTEPANVQKQTNKKSRNKQPPVMNAPITAPFMNFGMQPQIFQPNMMEAFMNQQMMPNMMPMMTPQQIMFLQQQQQSFTTFNAMNNMGFQSGFVPAPVPPPQKKQAKSPPVKPERASPSKTTSLKRRRELNTKEEVIEEEIRKSPVRETNSASSSPTSSPSCSPIPGDPDQKPEKDKDVKRQRRLIKNRESAQASRERKKVYVQGLEKRVDDLAQTNTALSSKVLTLEEENNLLREKLLALDRDGSISQELNEPSFKKRRLVGTQQAKIPIPSLQNTTSGNPFTNGFWNAFMGFAPPHLQAQTGNSWNPGAQSKKVVLFVMLFCVAVLVMSNSKNKEHLDSSNVNMPSVNINSAEGTGSFSIPTTTYRVGRGLKSIEDLSFNARVQPIMQEFFQYMNATAAAGEEEEEEEKQQCSKEEGDSKDNIAMEFDEQKGLTLTFPLAKIAHIKTEEGVELTKDMKMDQLSQRFIEEICKELKH